MNDQEFFDLAMKVIGREATADEQAQLDALVASQSAFKTQFEQIQEDARLARQVLPLLAAPDAPTEDFPTYARERLQTKVRETLGRSAPTRPLSPWNWRWIVGLAFGAAALVALVLIPLLTTPTRPSIEVALLDTTGTVRGVDSPDVDMLKQQWKTLPPKSFDQASQAAAWQTNWPAGSRLAVKVIYDRAAGEVRVWVHAPEKLEEKVFLVDRNLATTLKQADVFIREQRHR